MAEVNVIKIQLLHNQKLIIGRPAKPPGEELLQGIRSVLECFSSVVEAHLPQYFALSEMSLPRLILVAVVQDLDTEGFTSAGMGLLQEILPIGFKLDIVVLDEDSFFLPAVRNAGCRLK